MRHFTLLLLTLTTSVFGEITETSRERPVENKGAGVVNSHVILRDGKVIVTTVNMAGPDGLVNQRNHMLCVAGEHVATLEDKNADGTLNGVSIFDTNAGELEYFYVADDLELVPASSEEMDEAKSIAKAATSFIKDAMAGEGVTAKNFLLLRFRIWLLKWDVPMVCVLALAAVAGYFLGRRSPLIVAT